MATDSDQPSDVYEDFSRFYDLYVGDFLDDLPMYLERARGLATPILEIGAGSGRLTIPLARNGHDIRAVDVSASMLAILDGRLADEPADTRARVRVVLADVGQLALGELYDLVMVPYYAFNYLLTPETQRACLERIRAHMTDAARLIVDVFVPHGHIGRPNTEPNMRFDTLDPATGHRLRAWNTFGIDADARMEYRDQRLEITDADGRVQVEEFTIQRHYYLAGELERLVEAHGFRVLERSAGYRGEAAGPEAEQLVFVLGLDS